MTVSKEKIVEELKARAQKDLDAAKSAYSTSQGHATEDGMKSEGKYDTRSIEAGYLAGAQKKRVEELEHEVALLDEMDLTLPPESVVVGSLVEIELNNMKKLYFISSTSGGTLLNIDNSPVLVISAFSPIGSEAIGLSKDDSFELESRGESREYSILNIW